MSVITQCLRENKKADPYLSWPACDRLHRISQSWSDLVRSNIALEPKQINQMLIMKIDGMNFDGLSCKRNRVTGYRHAPILLGLGGILCQLFGTRNAFLETLFIWWSREHFFSNYRQYFFVFVQSSFSTKSLRR